MKFKFKRFIYLINDLTNAILKKDRREASETAKKYKKALIILVIVFAVSFAINLFLYFKICL